VTRKTSHIDRLLPMIRNLTWFDLTGFIGVLLIIVAYLLNAGGALLIIVSLIFAFNLSAFVVEVFWFLISLLGLSRSLTSRKDSQRTGRSDSNGGH